MKQKLSIKVQVAISAILCMGILTVAISLIGYKLYHDNVMESYTSYADTVLEYAYRTTLPYSFGDMIARREMPEDYEKLREALNEVKDSSHIEYLYAIYFADIEDIHSLHYAINAKNRQELSTGAPPSTIYTYMGVPVEDGAFADETLEVLRQAVKSALRENGTLEGYSEEYGHMLNGYRVIFDSEDNAVGLLCVEIDINRINQGVKGYARTVFFIAASFTGLIVLIYILNTQRYLVGPILRIAQRSDAFVKKMQSNTDPEELIYEDAGIEAGSELGMLADNVKSLANGVASYMTNLKAATSERERIGTELALATRIQEDMLPNTFPAFPDRADFDVYAVMDPAKEVGGDFYDFFLIDDTHLGLVMADVSGKGVPAALFMMVSKILVQIYAMNGHSPAQVLKAVNDVISPNNREEMFVTVWLGILDTETGKLTAANAGHEYPVLAQPNGAFELVRDKHGLVIGAMEGVCYREYELTLKPGAKLFLYTDGVPEATDASEQLFGIERMLAALNRVSDQTPEEILRGVRRAVDDFVREAEQFDDLTMLCLEYCGKGGQTSDARELVLDAEVDNLERVLGFLEEQLAAADCPMKAQMQLCVAAEEIFVNIASYAYAPGTGKATVRVAIEEEPRRAIVTFLDSGTPFDPLAREDPDVTLSAEERQIGGLGIFMTKKTMDDVSYVYRDGQNVLTLKKIF